MFPSSFPYVALHPFRRFVVGSQPHQEDDDPEADVEVARNGLRSESEEERDRQQSEGDDELESPRGSGMAPL